MVMLMVVLVMVMTVRYVEWVFYEGRNGDGKIWIRYLAPGSDWAYLRGNLGRAGLCYDGV
jgi:hypothetical protein